jgi:flavin-dependent dehydrogenase
VIGGGPAGSFFAYFLLDMAERAGIDIQLDIYEAKDFSVPGPAGCNHCGGVVHESLVQTLAVEGISLPSTVVQRAIDSFVLYMPESSVRMETPMQEKSIAVVHRGAGPRGIGEKRWRSFDRYLLELAAGKGARVMYERVDGVGWNEGRPQVRSRGESLRTYDLLAGAVGVNTGTLRLFEEMDLGYRRPRTIRTYVAELHLGQETVRRYLGSSMHVFLLNIPSLEFGALIPKGDYVTLVMLGQKVDQSLVQTFFNTPQVRQCLPSDWRMPETFCHCSPRASVHGAVPTFADRVVFIGDCGVTRLYKDGIGSAYRMAKAAAATAIFEGISAQDFRRHYLPLCESTRADNRIGKLLFLVARQVQALGGTRHGVMRMLAREQQEGRGWRMSMMMWDMFTGGAPYREVLLRTLHPAFWTRFARDTVSSVWLYGKALCANNSGTTLLGSLW